MNNDPSVTSFEQCAQRKLEELKDFAHREPLATVAAAVGVGVLINMLPARAVAGTVSIVGAMIARPLLLSLGLAKAMELCCHKPTTPTTPRP